ncbi:MAG: helicase [Candelina submexicana]|nr:MAG: helicase [Candelina submexicana]
MIGKPFQPPLLKKLPARAQDDASSCPTAKRRRISISDDEQYEKSNVTLSSRSVNIPRPSKPRQPLLALKNIVATLEELSPCDGTIEGYYTVLWRKFTAKKHKTWDGDGILSVTGGYAYLQDISGRDMGRVPCSSPLLPGSQLSVGGKDVEVDAIMSKEDFLAGRQFLKTAASTSTLVPKESLLKVKAGKKRKMDENPLKKTLIVAAPKSAGTKAQFKNPLVNSTVLPKKDGNEPTPRHDPSGNGALVMQRPKLVRTGKQIVDVVIDPLLNRHLREHQREGLKFMYECVMGMRSFDGQGVLLADEMGLGKTLQTIALLWTLLKQNPIYDAPPVIKKALIVCPVTLINNWRKEFRKWLGNERIGVFVADGTKRRLTDFTMGKNYAVMIIGYEKLRTVQEELRKGDGIDIVVADEGHRLKTAQNKSAQAIRALDTPRRIILSGTPIQNDLSEFFAMVDFINPGILGTPQTFKKEFEIPIVKSRQPGAARKEVEKGEARSAELGSLTSMFILRRTAEILSKYLPPKTEYVLFCRPTNGQASVYRAVLTSPVFNSFLGSPEAAFQLITLLKKVCNSPTLLNIKATEEPTNSSISTLLAGIPHTYLRSAVVAASGKLKVLDRMLHQLRQTTSEKVVLVSNYTSTLDLLASHLSSLSMPYTRLDGSTPVSKRQDIVDTFNRTPASVCFVFLLSAKAGGAGLNLIGASRLVLFEVDWNPSTDLQAMARIHRDGQKKECRIYRMLTQGALDEKIYQRQLTKQGLADSVMDNKASASSFSREELKDLFKLDEYATCQTHDLLGCCCGGRGLPIVPSVPAPDGDGESDDEDLPECPTLVTANKLDMDAQERQIRQQAEAARAKNKNSKMQSLMQYMHIDTTKFASQVDEEMEALIEDDVLLDVLKEEGNGVSFVFSKTSS